MNDEKDYISLKWGTLKEWNFKSEICKELFKEYHKLGYSFSAMMQNDTPEQKEIICKIIDESTAKEIFLDWDGIYVSKEKAKEYVMNYKR
jgi:hypothetical protein